MLLLNPVLLRGESGQLTSVSLQVSASLGDCLVSCVELFLPFLEFDKLTVQPVVALGVLIKGALVSVAFEPLFFLTKSLNVGLSLLLSNKGDIIVVS